MRPCDEYAALLDAYVDGELPLEDMARVQAHLESCPGCQAYVDDALAIRAAFPDVEDVEVPDGFAEAVSAAIRAGAAPQRKRRSPWVKVLAPLAACFAIVLLLTNLPGMGGNSARTTGKIASRDTAVTEDTTDTDSQEETDETAAPAENSEKEPASAKDEVPVPSFYAAQDAPAQEESGAGEEDRSTEVLQSPTEDEAAPESDESAGEEDLQPAVNAAVMEPEEPDAWVEYDNVVFASVVYLPQDVVGDALADREGKPYSNANHPGDGVIGTGYALDQAEFEHILDVLDYPLDPILNQDATTEQCCIVVTEDWHPHGSEPAE